MFTFSRAAVADKANTVHLHSTHDVIVAFKLFYTVIAILRHLPEFDPGDQRSPEVDGFDMRSCGRFWKKLKMNLCFIEDEEVRVSLRFRDLRVKLQMRCVKKNKICFIASNITRNALFRLKASQVSKTAPVCSGLLVPNDTVKDLVIGLV
ncbi:hypothetical protein Ddye_030119 [Dipteronia dyeriana]|uniref:Uncharacterized protein n=1 Tax=Dipteronia dyeriana TaxID=168575 RepID=A0AAD9WM64_9ROSI|nr:hypothetical protein Ddye_030119 [Dipteronia dyeriana]